MLIKRYCGIKHLHFFKVMQCKCAYSIKQSFSPFPVSGSLSLLSFSVNFCLTLSLLIFLVNKFSIHIHTDKPHSIPPFSTTLHESITNQITISSSISQSVKHTQTRAYSAQNTPTQRLSYRLDCHNAQGVETNTERTLGRTADTHVATYTYAHTHANASRLSCTHTHTYTGEQDKNTVLTSQLIRCEGAEQTNPLQGWSSKTLCVCDIGVSVLNNLCHKLLIRTFERNKLKLLQCVEWELHYLF